MSNDDFNVDECVAAMESIPDGIYYGTIKKVEFEPIETGGDVVVLALDIDYKGITRDVPKKYHVINDGVKEFLTKEMKKLEFDVASRQEFLALREKLVGVRARWKAQKNKDGFQCWYVVERVENGEEAPKPYTW